MAKELPAVPKVEVVAYTPEQVQDLVISGGDLGKLSVEQRADYLLRLCNQLGLNPLLKPFDFIPNGRGGLLLYANKSCASQLRVSNNISVVQLYAGPLMLGEEMVKDIYQIIVEASMPDGAGGKRVQVEVGAGYIGGLKGESLSNKVMHIMTKAIRRATLSIKGIGIPDESELEDQPQFAKEFEKRQSDIKRIEPTKPLDNPIKEAEIKADPALVGQ